MSGYMPIKNSWEIRGRKVIPLLLAADNLESSIPTNGCWSMHSLHKEMLLHRSPIQTRAPLGAGESHSASVCIPLPPLPSSSWWLAAQVLWQQWYLSVRAASSSSITAATNNMPVFHYQGGTDRNTWKHIVGLLKDSFVFSSQIVYLNGYLREALKL